jgi:hypothetical protein
MKKLTLLLSLLALGALGFTACGAGDDDQTAAASETEATHENRLATRTPTEIGATVPTSARGERQKAAALQSTAAGRPVSTVYSIGGDEERIEQNGNKWEAAFAAGRADCRYMGQPACERMYCERVGNWPIKNCTPPSAEFRESFADATVERVVVSEDHRHATAGFSNGESVEFEGQRVDEGDKGWGWGNWAYFVTERWIKNASRR